jgi:Xaa-Pro aminopeptidase
MHNYLARIKKLQKIISKESLSAFLVTNKTNILYLSGFSSSNGFLLITKQKSILFTDSRYIEEARYKIPKFFKLMDIKKIWDNTFLTNNSPKSKTAHKRQSENSWQKLLKNLKIKSLGFEGDSITYNRLKKYKKISPKIKFEDISGKIETLRAIKDPYEISLIKKGQKINEKVFLEIEKLIKTHLIQSKIHGFKNTKKTSKAKSPTTKPLREIDLVWEIKRLGFEYGAEAISFEPIVAFGKHTSQPHHTSDKTKLKKGDIVLIDMGMKYKGYCSDMTRMIFTAPMTKQQREVYYTVLGAQERAISQIKPNVFEQEIDTTARSYIKSRKYGKFFTHGTGHGVGLDIHESPSFRESTNSHEENQPKTSKKNLKNNKNKTSSKDTSLKKLLPGMIVTVEPGIYLPGKFGIRIEDMILITKKGNTNITNIQK